MSKDRPIRLPFENRIREQYFFSPQTLEHLTLVCQGNTACVCCPSLALKLDQQNHPSFTLFDIDERFAQHPFFVRYDLHRGIYSPQRTNPNTSYANSFDTVIIDPPFALATPKIIAQNAHALLGYQPYQSVYVGHLNNRETQKALISAFSNVGFIFQNCDLILEYQNPPARVASGRDQIRLYHFLRNV